MQRVARGLGVLAWLCLLAAPAAPVTVQAPIGAPGLYVFGDSLSDSGNAHRITGGLRPRSPPYYNGQFSNGPVWYQHVAAAFRAEGAETRNYAVGGAKALRDPNGIPDLNDQILANRLRHGIRRGSVAMVFIGGNDINARVGRASLPRVAREAADAVGDAAASLHRRGAGQVFVFKLPDFAKIPKYVNASDALRASATRGARAFNARIDHQAARLAARGVSVTVVDTHALFEDVWARPGHYGIDNLTVPCIRGGQNRCNARQRARSAFADSLHPGARLHRHLADHVLDLLRGNASARLLADLADGQGGTPLAATGVAAGAGMAAGTAAGVAVAPVPLPAAWLGLVAGIGGLGLLARRRRAA